MLRGVLPLVVPHERVGDASVLIDQEHGRPADVPGIQPHPVPHPVGLHHVATLVDQDVEGKAGLLDVVADGVAILCEDPGDLDAAGGVGVDVGGELTEPVAAVRSPETPVKIQEQPAAREEISQRAHPSFLIHEGESGRARKRGRVH